MAHTMDEAPRHRLLNFPAFYWTNPLRFFTKILSPNLYSPEQETCLPITLLHHGTQFGGSGSEKKKVLLALLDQFAHSPVGGRSHPTCRILVGGAVTTMSSVSSSHPIPPVKRDKKD